jgi:coenzyme F420-reducing hydrogenase alpha subunit
MHKFDLDIKNISKIEGHTHMLVKVRGGKVTECKLRVSQNQRFYKRAVEGVAYTLVPGKMSRICGTCSAAHTLATIEAIEKAFNVKISEQTYKLRRLLINAGHIRDHAMHLYFFCLPDIFNKESIFEFKGKLHDYVHDGLDVKEAGNYLATIVGGRAVHPPNAVVGGFTQFPSKQEMQEAVKKLQGVRKKILKIIDIFYKDKKTFKRKANYVALVNNDYNYLQGYIKTAHGTKIPEEKYAQHLEQVVLPYSTAAAFTFESKDYMVGALARMNLNKGNLHKNTKRDCSKYLKIFPNNCIFNNNTAQAIETLHGVDISIDILKDLQKTLKKEKLAKIIPKKSVGVGVVEAPRGTLYYKIDFGPAGKVTHADICIPTQQNIIHLEKDIAKYVESLLAKKMTKEKISLEVEKMIRAYDPCMSCATHFLKIDWR